MQPVCLTQLSFGAITVYGMAQMPLSDGQKNLASGPFIILQQLVDGSDGIGRKRLVSGCKQGFDVPDETQMFGFAEGMAQSPDLGFGSMGGYVVGLRGHI